MYSTYTAKQSVNIHETAYQYTNNPISQQSGILVLSRTNPTPRCDHLQVSPDDNANNNAPPHIFCQSHSHGNSQICLVNQK